MVEEGETIGIRGVWIRPGGGESGNGVDPAVAEGKIECGFTRAVSGTWICSQLDEGVDKLSATRLHRHVQQRISHAIFEMRICS